LYFRNIYDDLTKEVRPMENRVTKKRMTKRCGAGKLMLIALGTVMNTTDCAEEQIKYKHTER